MDFFDNPRELTRQDLAAMWLPQEYWGTTLEDIRDVNFRETIRNYVGNLRSAFAQSAGLYLWGDAASGKGAAAAVILKEARRRYKPGLFVAVWELRESIVNKIKYSYDVTPMEKAKSVDVLVLDGLDEEDGGAKLFTLTEISRLIVSRARNRKITIVTSRMPVQDLRQNGPFKKWYTDVELYMVAVNAPNPGNAVKARKAQMAKLLLGDD